MHKFSNKLKTKKGRITIVSVILLTAISGLTVAAALMGDQSTAHIKETASESESSQLEAADRTVNGEDALSETSSALSISSESSDTSDIPDASSENDEAIEEARANEEAQETEIEKHADIVKVTDNTNADSPPSTETETAENPDNSGNAQNTDNPANAEPEITETPFHAYIEMSNILQRPELPTGCEATALTIDLNYIGIPISKMETVSYMPQKGYGNDINYSFIGDPTMNSGLGIFTPGLAETANAILEAYGSEYKAIDISGSSPDTLYQYVTDGTPVIAWCSINLIEPGDSYTWIAYDTGARCTFISHEHCTVLAGVDSGSGTVTLNDPWSGIIVKSKSLFESRYATYGCHAMVLVRQHSYSSQVVAPTCTEGGYTVHTCSRCGDSYTDSETAALGHDWGEWVTTKEATTSEEGTQTRTCSRCGATETRSIAKISVPAATQADAAAIADKTIEYINQYRGTAATELAGKTAQYAQLRSQQLTTNFTDDKNDAQAAAASLGYGNNVSADSGSSALWEPVGKEEIVQAQGGSVNDIAHSLADSVYGSADQWNCVGSSQYPYISVGVTLSGSRWYCCIIVNDTAEYD